MICHNFLENVGISKDVLRVNLTALLPTSIFWGIAGENLLLAQREVIEWNQMHDKDLWTGNLNVNNNRFIPSGK